MTRIRAGSKHPTVNKLNRLFDFMRNELKLEISFYSDRFFITDLERRHEKDWDLCDQTYSQFISEIPCDKYKLCQDKDESLSILGMEPVEIPPYPKNKT
jgi:hypothetical protein